MSSAVNEPDPHAPTATAAPTDGGADVANDAGAEASPDPSGTPLGTLTPPSDVSRPVSSSVEPSGDIEDAPLAPPNAPFVAALRPPSSTASENRDSVASYLSGKPGTPLKDDGALDGAAALPTMAYDNEKTGEPSADAGRGGKRWSRRRIFVAAFAALAVLVLVVVVPVCLTVGKKSGKGSSTSGNGNGNGNSNGDGNNSTTSDGNNSSPTVPVTGGDGSLVTTEDGQTFVYNNSFGGFWVQDPQNPFNSSARPNNWTKPLTEKWDFVNDKIYGVNLGGWLVLEPFITPHFYQKYEGSVDEWTLSANMAADTANGGLDQLRNHYKTFITEKDIAQIAGAGLNWVRLPIPYWAIETWEGEPFLAKESWTYVVKLFQWCRKYGLRVNLDLHAVPGSQNGFNHSGRLGATNWMRGLMGLANAQRTLDYIRQITEFLNQEEYKNVVPIFGIVNETPLSKVGIDHISRFYLQAHNMIRNITGVGDGLWISIGDGFGGTESWQDFLPGADRFIMDHHPYFAFSGSSSDPFLSGTGHSAGAGWPAKACSNWRPRMLGTQQTFGVTIAGEFSNGWNDCGLFLHGAHPSNQPDSQTYAGDCTEWTVWEKWDAAHKDGLNNFVRASMDTLENWFFWTWKIGPDVDGNIRAPLWSYSLGLEHGWIPKDPREADGTCASYGVKPSRFDGADYQGYQIGKGDGQVAASALASVGQWPPPTLPGFPEGLGWENAPVYTPTGVMSPLPRPTFTGTATGKDAQSTITAAPTTTTTTKYVPVSGCVYPDPWTGGPTQAPVCVDGAGPATLGAAAATGLPVGSIVPTSTAPAGRR